MDYSLFVRNAKCVRKRRGARGAVAVEGIIVVTFMTGVMVGTWFIHHVFFAKWGTLQIARAGAWQTALAGCDSDQIADLYTQTHDESKNANAEICPAGQTCESSNAFGLPNDGTGTPPSWMPNEMGSPGQSSVTVATVNWPSHTVSTAMTFSCNEKPKDELVVGSTGVMDGITDMAKKIIEEEQTPQSAGSCVKIGTHAVAGTKCLVVTRNGSSAGTDISKKMYSLARQSELDNVDAPDPATIPDNISRRHERHAAQQLEDSYTMRKIFTSIAARPWIRAQLCATILGGILKRGSMAYAEYQAKRLAERVGSEVLANAPSDGSEAIVFNGAKFFFEAKVVEADVSAVLERVQKDYVLKARKTLRLSSVR